MNETVDSIKVLKPNCDKMDYILAASSGALCGIIDIFLVGKPGESPLGNITDKWFDARTMDFAKLCHPEKKKFNDLDSALRFLEKEFKVPYDQTGLGDAGRSVFDLTAKNHHFKSLAHNPSLLGLFFSILDQFSNTSHFVTDGQLISLQQADEKWELRGGNIPSKLFCGFTNWIGHLISDMSGSSSSAAKGNRGTVNQKHYEASCVITVKEHIKFTDKEIQLTIKSSKKLNVKVDPADVSVAWKSSAPSVVSVDNNGVVTGISQGSATITATVLVNGAPYSDSCTVTVGPYIDLSLFFREKITEKDGKKYYEDFRLGEKVFDNWPQNSSQDEKHALLVSFLKNESVTAEIEEKLYNLLFNAQYRPDIFGGNNSNYPTKNGDEYTDHLYDNNLGKTMIFKTSNGTNVYKHTCAGCMHYANSAMVYLYGKPSGNTIEGIIQMQVDDLNGRKETGTAENVKKYLERAVPGSHIRFNYGSSSVHSIVFLGRDDSNKGFYYISFMGGGDYGTIMSVGYTTYLMRRSSWI